jgi:hypothetical protein
MASSTTASESEMAAARLPLGWRDQCSACVAYERRSIASRPSGLFHLQLATSPAVLVASMAPRYGAGCGSTRLLASSGEHIQQAQTLRCALVGTSGRWVTTTRNPQ